TRPGTKKVARTPNLSSASRIRGTATLAPYVPWERTPGFEAFAGSSPIHTSSASKSNVKAAAARFPSGHTYEPPSPLSLVTIGAGPRRQHPSFDGGPELAHRAYRRGRLSWVAQPSSAPDSPSGSQNSTRVPEAGAPETFSQPPHDSARSRMLSSPRCPARADRSGPKPLPSSLTCTSIPPRERSRVT